MLQKTGFSDVTLINIVLTTAAVFTLFITFNLYIFSEKKIDRANEQRLIALQLVDQLRQSSNDLARMAKIYLMNGNPLYKRFHQNILDIRDGKISRPDGYFYVYWDMVLGNTISPPIGDRQGTALLDLMRQSNLTDEELGKLTDAKNSSDSLAKLEQKAMEQGETNNSTNAADRYKQAFQILSDENYHKAMAKVMKPINDVYLLINKRTLAAVNDAEKNAFQLRLALIAAALAVSLMLWRSYASLHTTLGGSADEVQAQISKIERGDFSTDTTIKPGMGNSVIAGLSRMQNTLQANEIERKRTEAELRIAAVAFESQESLMITDARGIILRVNRAFTETTGYTAEEAVGQTPRLLKSGRHDTDFYRTMWETINHTGTWRGEIWGRRKNGELYPKWLTISTVRGEDNKITHYVGSYIDITELSNAKIAAENASRAKSEFLSSMSHELRTPLNAILGFAQLLEQGPPAPTLIQTGRIKEIVRSGWYLLDLINEILDLVAIESGRIPLSLSWIPLHELLLECVTMMEAQAKLRNITISFYQPDQSLLLYADRIRVKQVLINFLSNAIKYNCENGIIEIACNPASTPNQARISIRDTGKGLPANKLEQLFQPFNRLGQETGPIEGTGIGLVLAKKLTEQMGGTIGVDSTVGTGSVFWFELPASGGFLTC